MPLAPAINVDFGPHIAGRVAVARASACRVGKGGHGAAVPGTALFRIAHRVPVAWRNTGFSSVLYQIIIMFQHHRS
jgi:hypothetical protein